MLLSSARRGCSWKQGHCPLTAVPVAVFHCCVINYHRGATWNITGLSPDRCCESRIYMLSWVFASEFLMGLDQGVGQSWSLIRRFNWGKIYFWVPSVVGWTQFLLDCWMWSLGSCWLLARAHSQLIAKGSFHHCLTIWHLASSKPAREEVCH
jgi:hypothetical protein